MTLGAAYDLARALMDRYGLRDWQIEFRRWKKLGAACHRRERKIQLSADVVRLNGREGVAELVLHEIAHAFVPGLHNRAWVIFAQKIGCTGEPNAQSRVVWPEGKWMALCRRCGEMERRFRESKRVAACPACKGARALMRVEEGGRV